MCILVTNIDGAVSSLTMQNASFEHLLLTVGNIDSLLQSRSGKRVVVKGKH